MFPLHGCALAKPGGPWRLTFALGRLENLRFFIKITCWAPWILQVQSTGVPSIFLRAQPCTQIIISILSHGACGNILMLPQKAINAIGFHNTYPLDSDLSGG